MNIHLPRFVHGTQGQIEMTDEIPARTNVPHVGTMNDAGQIADHAHKRSVDTLVADIGKTWCQMVSGIVRTGQLVRELRQQTEHGEWSEIVANRLPFAERTAHQLISIADHPVLSNPRRAADLPAKWSLLADLTALAPEQAEQAIRDGRIHPRLKRDEIRTMIRPHRAPADPSIVPTQALAAPETNVEDRQHCYRVAALIASVCQVKPEEVLAATRLSNRSTLARQLLAYALRTNNNWDATRTGRAMVRDRTTVEHSCRLIEDLRDDQTVDEWVESVCALVVRAQELSDSEPQLLAVHYGRAEQGVAA